MGFWTVALYLGTLAIGSAALHLLNENGVVHRVAIVFVIIITSAINFVFSQLLFREGDLIRWIRKAFTGRYLSK